MAESIGSSARAFGTDGGAATAGARSPREPRSRGARVARATCSGGDSRGQEEGCHDGGVRRRSARCSSKQTPPIGVVCPALVAAGGAVPVRGDDGPLVTVMTRNLYFGTSFDHVVAGPDSRAFFLAVAAAFNEAQARDWPARGVAVGGRDREKRARSAGEGAVANTDPLRLLRHSGRKHRAGRMTLSNPQAAQYAAHISIPTVVGPIPLRWARASVDGTIAGHALRFASTHRDPNYGPAQTAQAHEVLAGPGQTSLPLVWVGDFNSDADNPPSTAFRRTRRPTATWWPPASSIPGRRALRRAGVQLLRARRPTEPAADARPANRPRPHPRRCEGRAGTAGRQHRAGPAGNRRWSSDHAGVVATLGPG
jgi:endonuclease/exonuclease/phosphatase family metal-dependent hydrolase